MAQKNKRVRDTSLWKFTGCAWGIRVNFSPCVMTWAVLAKVVFCHSQRVWRIVNVDSKVIISI